MNRGARLFAEWLRDTERSQQEASYDLRVTPSALSMYLTGERTPGRKIALKLRDIAGVPVDAWDDLEGTETAPEQTPATREPGAA